MSGCFSCKIHKQSIKEEIHGKSNDMYVFLPLTPSSSKLLLPLIFINLADELQARELIAHLCNLKENKRRKHLT